MQHIAQDNGNEHITSCGESINRNRKRLQFAKLGEGGESDSLSGVDHNHDKLRWDERDLEVTCNVISKGEAWLDLNWPRRR